jgi:hypothetical protein
METPSTTENTPLAEKTESVAEAPAGEVCKVGNGWN